ncbi:hypothetical protein [Thiococcus pfennigii]|uniref:hypothetical protein n=1 Tax=Thiococcus pfennigii TaxID=1057 RepID=UPI0019059F28|nr:hypothetical protein [Thiococcus pfennigii]MBK1701089.1 hypothetical protein [Thiococcus pfennigii]
MPHLFIAITAHGYGHLAQVAPIAQALAECLPGLRITLQGPVAPSVAAARLPRGFRHVPTPADVALPMASPVQVRWDEGLDLYRAFDAEHERHLARQQALLAAERPDLVLADVPWLPLAAARTLGIPAVALCSLNWLDILAASPVGARLPPALVEHMHAGYAGADIFLRPAPSMPMPWLPNGRDIGPIALQRARRPEAIRARLGIPAERRLVLMLFGGTGALPLGEGEPLPDGIEILVPNGDAAAERPGVSALADPSLDVLDVLASCDAIITKPGYGTFAEAACNGVPVLYVPRGDWPEEGPLVDWLAARVPTAAVAATDFATGRIAASLADLLAAGPAPPVPATGIAEAVALLRPWLE